MPGILKRFQQLETDESPKAAQSSGLSAQSVETVHPERSTLSPEPSHGPPGALEPIGLFWPYGETEFSWIYRQLHVPVPHHEPRRRA